MHFFHIFILIAILSTCSATNSTQCPPLPVECLCTHKHNKDVLQITCSDLKYVSFNSLPGDLIMEIDLTNNQIESLNKTSFPHPNMIQKLSLRDNNIKYIGPSTFDKFFSLKKLDLSKNQLVQIESFTFAGLRSDNISLLSLNLQENKIVSISSGAFYWLTIEKLILVNQQDFYGNQASLIAYQDFMSISRIKEVDLGMNNLLCDCTMSWLNRHINKISNARCFYPQPIRGTFFKEIAGPDWKCEKYRSLFTLPKFHIEPSPNQILVKNDALICSCQTTYVDQGIWTWQINGIDLVASSNIIFTHESNYLYATSRSVLTIMRINTSVDGKLTCTFTVDASGSINGSVVLRVLTATTNNKCSSVVTATERGSLTWPTSLNGATVQEPCPNGGINNEFATRQCTNGSWGYYSLDGCYFENLLTKKLQRFYFQSSARDTDTIYKMASDFSAFFQEHFHRLETKYDFYFVYKTLFEIMKTYGKIGTGKYSRFFWGSVGLVASLYSDEAALDQILYGTTSSFRFRRLLELYMLQESVGKSLYSIKHQKSMAATSTVQASVDSSSWQCYVILPPNNPASKVGLQVICPSQYDPSLSTISVVEINSVCSLCSSSVDLRITSIVYLSRTFFKNFSVPSMELVSPVVGFTIQENLDSFNISQAFKERTLLTFRSSFEQINPRLVYWKYGKEDDGVWEFIDDCKMISPTRNTTQFECYISNSLFKEMLYFSLAMKITYPPFIKPKYMEVVLYVAAVITVILLFITLCVYLFLRELRYNRSDAGVLLNLCLVLLICELLFVFGMHRTDSKYVCKGVAIALQYFLLAALFWLACGGVVLIRLLKKKYRGVPNQYDPILKYYLLAWGVIETEDNILQRQYICCTVIGIPSIICSITVAYDRNIYGSDDYCWLKRKPSLVAFIVPAGITLLVDLIIFCYLHAVINKVYPELLDSSEPEQEELLDRDTCRTTGCKYKIKPYVPLEQRFPVRVELMCYLRGCLLVILLLTVTFTSCVMMYSYKSSSSRYLYLLFSYGSAISNVCLGPVMFYFNCIKRKDVWKRLMHLYSNRPCAKPKNVPVNKEALERNTPAEEGSLSNGHVHKTTDIVSNHSNILDASLGVCGLSDQVQSQNSQVATAVLLETGESYAGRGESTDELVSNKNSDAVLSRTVDLNVNDAMHKVVSKQQSEVSGTDNQSNGAQESIGDCSLTSSRRNQKKNPDIPENLKSFVPENWRPVKRRGKSKGASFYPYYLNESAPFTASAAYSSKSSSVASTTVSGVPLFINKKRAANNLAMYNEMFKQNIAMNSLQAFQPGLPPNMHIPLPHNPTGYSHAMLPSPGFTQKRGPGMPIKMLKSVQEVNTSQPSSLSSTVFDTSNVSSMSSNLNNNVESNKLISKNNANTDQSEVEEEPPIRVAPALYVCMPHVSIKQFQLRSETSV